MQIDTCELGDAGETHYELLEPRECERPTWTSVRTRSGQDEEQEADCCTRTKRVAPSPPLVVISHGFSGDVSHSLVSRRDRIEKEYIGGVNFGTEWGRDSRAASRERERERERDSRE